MVTLNWLSVQQVKYEQPFERYLFASCSYCRLQSPRSGQNIELQCILHFLHGFPAHWASESQVWSRYQLGSCSIQKPSRETCRGDMLRILGRLLETDMADNAVLMSAVGNPAASSHRWRQRTDLSASRADPGQERWVWKEVYSQMHNGTFPAMHGFDDLVLSIQKTRPTATTDTTAWESCSPSRWATFILVQTRPRRFRRRKTGTRCFCERAGGTALSTVHCWGSVRRPQRQVRTQCCRSGPVLRATGFGQKPISIVPPLGVQSSACYASLGSWGRNCDW